MGSARDRAPDLTRSPTEARPPLPTRPRLRPIASTESPGAPLPWQEPPRSGGAAPAPSLRAPATLPPGRQPKLLDPLRNALRSRHNSRRTEQSYCQSVKRFIFSHNVRHPADMAKPEINAFLTHLALKEKACGAPWILCEPIQGVFGGNQIRSRSAWCSSRNALRGRALREFQGRGRIWTRCQR